MSAMIRNSSTCLLMLLLAPVAMADEQPTENATADTVAELSVAPLDHVTYPEDRPQWVVDADNGKRFPATDGNKIVIVSRLCESRKECEERLMISAKAAADQYVIDLVDFVADRNFYDFSDQQIQDLITREYDGTAMQGDTKMYERAIELTFTAGMQREIKAASKNVEVNRRLRGIGGLFLGGLVALFGSSALLGTVSRVRCRRK